MKWEDLDPEVSLQANVSLGEINKAIPTRPWWTTYFEKKPLNIRLFLFHRVQSTNNTHLVLFVLHSDCRGVCTLYVVWALTKRSFFDSEIWKYRPRICLHKVSLCLAFVTVFVFVFDRIGRCANPGLQTSEPVCLGLLHDPGPAITPLPLISSKFQIFQFKVWSFWKRDIFSGNKKGKMFNKFGTMFLIF